MISSKYGYAASFLLALSMFQGGNEQKQQGIVEAYVPSSAVPVSSPFLRLRSGVRHHDSRLFMSSSDDASFENMVEPLAEGIDSVKWLPSLKNEKSETISSFRQGAEIIPFFPLGGIVYTPHSTHVLNIFEPRYRKMYNDILMNGSKRFIVAMAHPEEEGRFAETGVIFHLEDLKEVSEMTADQIKYICSHKVTGRAKIHRVLNPEVWETREDYMRVEATILEEEDGESDNAQLAAISEEESLKKSYSALVDLQHDLEEDVRFTRASVNTLSVNPGGGDDSLWLTVRLWQSYIEQRLNARQNEMQKEFQEKLIKYLTKDKDVSEDQLPRYALKLNFCRQTYFSICANVSVL